MATITPAVLQLYKQDPLDIGDSTFGSNTAAESRRFREPANPFFAHWMGVWARKLAISRALGKISIELKHSARRTELAIYTADSVRLPSPDWCRQHPVDEFQLQRAVGAIDVFPRCALLLTAFEGLSIEDTAILLGSDNAHVSLARAIGLAELAKNLAYEQGWVTQHGVPSRPALEAVDMAT